MAVGLLKILNSFSIYRLYSNQRSIFVCPRRAFTNEAGEEETSKVTKVSTKNKLEALDLPTKPKRPLSSFMLFLFEMKDDIVKSNPHFKYKHIVKEGAALWRNSSEATKDKFAERARENYIAYSKEITEYKSKLTKEQEEGLKDLRDKKRKSKHQRSLNKRLKAVNKPKRPATSFFRYCMDECKKNNVSMISKIKELSAKWKIMSESEKGKYEEQYRSERQKYEKDLSKWEDKMIADGNEDLVRKRTTNNPTGGVRTDKLKKNKAE